MPEEANTEIVVESPKNTGLTVSSTPADLMRVAIEQGADIDKLATLMDLQLRWEAHENRKAYETAMATFKRNVPTIIKSKKVSFPNKDGGKTTYWHAELAETSEIVEQALLNVGIRHSWRLGDLNGKPLVTCIFTHERGHSEEVATLSGPPDTSGGKNSIQAIGSTTTYLQRYTLLAGAGIVPEGLDDDGASSGMDENAITDYCIQMQDAVGIEELQASFKTAFLATKQTNDLDAQQRIVKVYNERKKELRK